MNLQIGNYNGLFEGNISLVYSSDSSSISYIELSKSAKYDVDIVYSFYLGIIGSVNNYFNVQFYCITDNLVIAQCPVYYNNTNSAINQLAHIKGIYQLDTGKSYTVRISNINNSTLFTQVSRLSIDIKEFVSLYS